MSLVRPICAFYHMQRPYIHISREMGSLRTGNLKVLYKVDVKWNKRKIYLVIHSHVLFYITFTDYNVHPVFTITASGKR